MVGKHPARQDADLADPAIPKPAALKQSPCNAVQPAPPAAAGASLCPECGCAFTPAQAHQKSCSAVHKRDWHLRRRNRGLDLLAWAETAARGHFNPACVAKLLRRIRAAGERWRREDARRAQGR